MAGLRNAEAASFAESARQVRACGGLGDRPVIVLTRGEPVRGDAELERQSRFELQPARAHLSTRGTQRFAM